MDKKRDLRVGQIAQDLIFETVDGYVTAGAMSDDEWRGMCRALKKPEWECDPRFKTTAARFINAKDRLAETAAVIKGQSSDYWLKSFEENGVPSAPVLTRPQMLEDVQVKHNEIINEYKHPGIGRVRQVRPAARFSGFEKTPNPIAPRLGEHNKEILTSIGYSREQIEDFSANRVLTDFNLSDKT